MKGFVDYNECVKHLNTSIYSVLKVKFSVGRCKKNFARKIKFQQKFYLQIMFFFHFASHWRYIEIAIEKTSTTINLNGANAVNSTL